ncbi:TetR/AcrR family transcriptional regulator [Pseudomonadales bacterium]|nr:TetR/AcrR family transcriptional regulator [Pseudomonadales bacterium]
MPRPLLFDETEVINQSMKLFWKQGYVATGISQILQTVALKPGSFYNVFPSKKDLFVRSLTHYQHHIVAGRIAKHLDNKENPLDAIESFFLSSFENVPKNSMLGCLLTNTATEIGSHDADISQVVWSGMEMIESAFRRRIVEAQALALIGPEKDPDALSLHLLSCFQGLGVVGRLTQDKIRLKRMTQSALDSLRLL